MVRCKLQKQLAITICAASVVITWVPALSADGDSPLDPSFQTVQQIQYWKDKVVKMDVKQVGKVTKEGYLKYYSDLWDTNAPVGKKEVTINELAEKSAAMESQNPLEPEYKTVAWRRQHVATIDPDRDGTVSRDEFLKHMAMHWAEETRLSQTTSLTTDQAVQMMARNPLDRRYNKFHETN